MLVRVRRPVRVWHAHELRARAHDASGPAPSPARIPTVTVSADGIKTPRSREVDYTVIRTDGVWRVDEIVYADT